MRSRYLVAWLALVLVLGLAASAPAAAQESGGDPAAGYSIEWATVDGGGGSASGGAYGVSATIGQADAGPRADGMSGGPYTLKGGFWSIINIWRGHRYLPLIVRD